MFLITSVVSLVSCLVCTGVTAAGIQMRRDELLGAKLGWADQPYMVGYNTTLSGGRSIVAANILITASLASLIAACSLYTSICLVLELEMRDPEREMKLAQGDTVSRVIRELAEMMLEKKDNLSLPQRQRNGIARGNPS